MENVDCASREGLQMAHGAQFAAARVVTPLSIREYRKSRRESQERFWARFGVTQSRGSRFELGMAIPAPVVILLHLYWGGIVSEGDLWRARRRPLTKRPLGSLKRN